MESESNPPPLVAIVGETASGKSALALELAREFNGEIIAADSRTVYKHMDIGTAKPTPFEQNGIRHHMLDVVDPGEPFTAAQFKELAQHAITDITTRGKMPFLVGGTGLYVDALLYDFSFRTAANNALRAELQTLNIDELQARLIDANIPLPNNPRNPRHLIRALETGGALPERQQLRPHTLLLGLYIDREVLRQKVTRRVDMMIEQGFITEVQAVATQYGWNAPALQAPGYKAFRGYLKGDINLEAAKELFIRNDLQLAKRQRTWFRRNSDIIWIRKKEEAVDLITTFLNK